MIKSSKVRADRLTSFHSFLCSFLCTDGFFQVERTILKLQTVLIDLRLALIIIRLELLFIFNELAWRIPKLNRLILRYCQLVGIIALSCCKPEKLDAILRLGTRCSLLLLLDARFICLSSVSGVRHLFLLARVVAVLL